MRIFIILFFLTACQMACLAQPAFAQSKKELAAQDAALAERILRLEQRLLTGDPAAERLMQRMDALEAEQRGLTGEVEQLRYERDTLHAEIKAMNEELASLEELAGRTRLHLGAVDLVAQERQERQVSQQRRGMNGTGYQPGLASPAPPPQSYGSVSPSPSQVPSPPITREVTIPVQEDYVEVSKLPETGRNKLMMGDYSGAQRDFQLYLQALPDAEDAGEINYWLGETLYVKGAYADAAAAYIVSMRKAPMGAKGPDAMIKLGASLREIGNRDAACQTFASFSSQYPSAPSSAKAKLKSEQTRTGCS